MKRKAWLFLSQIPFRGNFIASIPGSISLKTPGKVGIYACGFPCKPYSTLHWGSGLLQDPNAKQLWLLIRNMAESECAAPCIRNSKAKNQPVVTEYYQIGFMYSLPLRLPCWRMWKGSRKCGGKFERSWNPNSQSNMVAVSTSSTSSHQILNNFSSKFEMFSIRKVRIGDGRLRSETWRKIEKW